MLFQEALELLQAGEMLVRESWKAEEGYLVLMEGMKYVWKILFHPTPNAGNHSFSVEELSATDWKVFNSVKDYIHQDKQELAA
jgi:hypothetical protein